MAIIKTINMDNSIMAVFPAPESDTDGLACPDTQ
jgi:hypothetical protein